VERSKNSGIIYKQIISQCLILITLSYFSINDPHIRVLLAVLPFSLVFLCGTTTGNDRTLTCPNKEGSVHVGAPIPDCIKFTIDIHDTDIFPISFEVFHCSSGHLPYICNFDKTHANSPVRTCSLYS
jgi:hypothetical protein